MPITIPLPDGPPKRQLIELAYGDCALAGYELGRTPEEINDALTRMNIMMTEWPFNLLGFVQPAYGVGSADDLSGIPAEAAGPVAAHLALRLAPAMGKTLSDEARGNIARGMASLHALVAAVPTMPYQANTPRGAGHRGADPFINETVPVDLTDDPGDLAGIID